MRAGARLGELGVAPVIAPSDLQRAAIAAMQEAPACLKAEESTAAMADRMASFNEREQVVGTAAWRARERRFAS